MTNFERILGRGLCLLSLSLLFAFASAGVEETAVVSPPARRVAPLPAMTKRAVERPKEPLPGESIVLCDSGSNQFTLFLPKGWQAPQSGEIGLTVHFHSAAWFAIQEHLRHGLKGPLVTAQLGAASSAYRKPFENPKRFAEWLELVAKTLKEHGAPANSRIVSLEITSFSAGYGAVRELLKTPEHFKLIRRIVLSDSIYGNLEKSAGPTQVRVAAPESVAPWIPFVKAAAQGEKTFVLTHSQVPTPTYASSGEMAAALIKAVGAPVEKMTPMPPADDPECRLQYRSDLGRFHVWGYAGSDGQAHMAHLRHLAEVWMAAAGDE